ncbi:hypothetical protein F5Y00DRAFT_274365 [Daldinia vernicosa]|uniref:uncharacterized protein n=1 Tax=Daldinia vernicosa TaxID=114800 RepID=UPI002008A6D7|nr:uncharacterized protein F5Y00DRAFT_274365 [Daldinia vernicosa]KAI0852149.1 hypothetical protein F5Y00DRAFT_274365 [Daldinia vernicosa]
MERYSHREIPRAHPSAHLLCTTWLTFGVISKEVLGFEALAVVIRHLYAHLPISYWDDLDSEPLLLFRFARLTPVDAIWEFGGELKEKAILELCPDWQSAAGAETASFSRLIESEKLISHFWSRKEYLLFSRSVISKSPGGAEWKEIATRDVETVAKAGLVQYDGTTPISREVSSRFGEFANESSGHRYLQASTFPVVIRVLYTPAPTATARFKDLQTVVLTSPHLQRVDGAQGQPRLRKLQDTYCLIASVRLRAEPASPDYVRTYDIKGTFIRPPVAGNNIVNEDWELGEQGHSYMLFYTFEPRGVERFEHQTERIRISNRMRTAIEGMNKAELAYRVTQQEVEEDEEDETELYERESLIPMANYKVPEDTRDGPAVAPDTRRFEPPQQVVPFEFPRVPAFPPVNTQTRGNMPAEPDIENEFSGVHPDRLRNIRPSQSSREEPQTRLQTPNQSSQVGFQFPSIDNQMPFARSQGSRTTSSPDPRRRRSPSSHERGRDDGGSKKPRSYC